MRSDHAADAVILESDDRRSVRTFVLRGGRMTRMQERAIDLLYDRYVIDFSPQELDLQTAFVSPAPVVVEIGFGMGHSTARIAEMFPQRNFLGIEVFLAGIGSLLQEIDRRNLKNLMIIRFNAVDVLHRMIPDESVSGFHVFFPDPWPKKKHQKRRLVQADFITTMVSKLSPGGYIYLVTDWQPYADWMLNELGQVPGLKALTESGCLDAMDFCPPISWRPQTKFELKGLQKQHRIFEIWVEKVS